MRFLICALAVSAVAFADVIGGSAELNPVRTHPHAGPLSASHRVIVKLRASAAANSSKLQVRLLQDRFASLAARSGLTTISPRLSAYAPLLGHSVVRIPLAGVTR